MPDLNLPSSPHLLPGGVGSGERNRFLGGMPCNFTPSCFLLAQEESWTTAAQGAWIWAVFLAMIDMKTLWLSFSNRHELGLVSGGVLSGGSAASPPGRLCSLHASSDIWLCSLLRSHGVGAVVLQPTGWWGAGRRSCQEGLPLSWDQTPAMAVGTSNKRHLLWTTPNAVVTEESW